MSGTKTTIAYRPRCAGLSLLRYKSPSGATTFYARCYDVLTRKQNTKAFKEQGEALTWGREEMSRLTLGQSRGGSARISDYLADFLAYKRDTRQVTAQQVRTYEITLERLMKEAHCDDLKDERLIEKAQRWINTALDCRYRVAVKPRTEPKRTWKAMPDKPVKKAQPLSPSKRAKLVVLLKGFGSWLHVKRGWINNPFSRLESPPKHSVEKEVFSVDECRALCSDASIVDDDGLYFAFLLYSGMRQQEAAWLRTSHIAWNEERIIVTLPDATDAVEGARLHAHLQANVPRKGLARTLAPAKKIKRNKERRCILFQELAQILTWHLLAREGEKDQYLFPDRYRLMDSHQYNKTFAKVCARVGVALGERTGHNTRHTNTCLVLATGHSDLMTRLHLGHESLQTTAGYGNRAMSMHQQCKTWGQQLRLRASAVNKSCASGTGQPLTTEASADAGPVSPEDDLSDCEYIILPDHSPVVREHWNTPVVACLGTHNLSVAGSSPARPTTQPPDTKQDTMTDGWVVCDS
jgi:integrase